MSTLGSKAVIAAAQQIIDRTYILHDQLGQGGMGAVYEATNRSNGERVALKLVSSDALDTDSVGDGGVARRRMALAREFQTLASLHHPHVVRVLGYGFDRERGPYYTMELLQSAQTLLEAGHGRSLSDKILLLAQLLRALDYVHRRGIFHRDIKPNNVLCVRDEVKLLDFGIAAREDQPSDPAGTVSYMAPELLFGATASAASDLYSVGVMFWQMLTGAMPYGPTRSSQVMRSSSMGTPTEQTLPAQVVQVLKEKSAATQPIREPGSQPSSSQPLSPKTPRSKPSSPKPAQHHVETDATDPASFSKQLAQAGISSEQKLELSLALLGDAQAIIGPILLRMLKRKREQRYQQASDVLHDLRLAIGDSVAVETVATRESFLQAAELVGRESELELLGQALSEAQEGRGSGFMIGGESGVGKSRLLHEIATQALVQGALLLRGHAAIEGRTLYHEWRPIVRTLCLHIEVRDDEAAVLQWVVPDLRHVLGRAVPPASKAVRAQAGESLKQVLEALVRRLGRPLVIILEDLQWFGTESLALLDHMSRCAQTLPLLMLSSYRHDESPQLPERLPALSLLRLERLTADHVARLCDLMLGPSANSNGLQDFLYRETEGNAFFIVEVMRALAEQSGELSAVGAQGVDNVRAMGMEQVLRRRIERVPERFRALLQLAAAGGREIDLKVMAQIAPESRREDWLRACANAAVLEYQEGAWRFTHDKLREYVLAHIEASAKKDLHRRIAEAMEALYTDSELEDRYAAIGQHHALAEQFDRASGYLLHAGDNAMRLCLNPAARAHYAEAAAAFEKLPPSPQTRRRHVESLLKLTRASLISDSSEQNLQRLHVAEGLIAVNLAESSASSPHPDDELLAARAQYFMGRAYHYAARYPDAIRCYQRVLPVAERFSDPELIAMPAGMLGFSLTCQGYVARGSGLLEQALKHLDPVLEPYDYLRTSGILAAALAARGMVTESRAEMERALLRAHEINQPSALALIHGLCSCAHLFLGDWPTAVTCGERIVELSFKTGDKVHQFIGYGMLAWAHGALDHHELVQSYRSSGQALAQAMGGRLMLSDWFDAVYAGLLLRAGRDEEAYTQAQQVAAQARAAKLPMSLGIALRTCGAALAQLHPNRFAEAQQHLVDSVAALESGGALAELARTHVAWSEACLSVEDRPSALRHLTTAAEMFRDFGCDYALREVNERIELLSRDSS